MIIQTIKPGDFDQKVRDIKSQVSSVLRKWDLLPRFKRWRLTQDPDTGMIVLFGILNDAYIAAHTSIPFRDYFDARVLHDLANQLQLQVVSCNSDGLRYAFILDRGRLGRLPTHIDFPFIDNGKVLVRVVYSDSPPAMGASAGVRSTDEHARVHEAVGALLKGLNEAKLPAAAALQLPGPNQPDVVLIDRADFVKRLAEQEATRRSNGNLLRKMYDRPPG